MFDFSNAPQCRKCYNGKNGSKISINLNDELYMVKFPKRHLSNKNLSYSNSPVSDYLGSHIFNMLGMPAQETILGNYTYNGIKRIAVACKDFVKPNLEFFDFASVKNRIIDSNSNGYGTEINDILDTIETQNIIDSDILKNYFWDMFIIDALIGNWDRHNGNWGFLYKQEDDSIILAPIYDCGSALFPQLDDDLIKKILSSKQALNSRVYEIPTSAIIFDGSRGNYYEIINSHKYKDCDKALLRIFPRIDLNKINHLIDDVECITKLQKEFLKKIISLRCELILNKAYKHIIKENN